MVAAGLGLHAINHGYTVCFEKMVNLVKTVMILSLYIVHSHQPQHLMVQIIIHHNIGIQLILKLIMQGRVQIQRQNLIILDQQEKNGQIMHLHK